MRLLPILALLTVGALPPPALAQPVLPPGAPSPASPLRLPGARAPSRLQSVEESSTNAAAPGDLRPERPVVPQIDIRFGESAAEPPIEPTTASGRPAPPGGIDDAAARCQAEEDAILRAECRDRNARTPAPK